MMHPDKHFATLDQSIPNEADRNLAKQFAPRLLFDKLEPFFPSVVGYTIFREDGESPSFPRRIELTDGATICIEYAVWWDWDIQHLYELEHVWIYLDADENVVRADASWHGGWNQMLDADSNVPNARWSRYAAFGVRQTCLCCND